MRKAIRHPAKAVNHASRAPRPTAPAPAPGARGTYAALNPATPLEVMVTRAIDQELAWYFVYAENALRRESVGLLPSYAVAAVLSSNPTEDVLLGKAHELARRVEDCLRAVADRHASIIRAVYTPRRWPRNVEAEFHALAPVVVRLVVASDPWPARSAHAGLEEAAAARLSARLMTGKALPLARLKGKARRLFGSAVMAYTKRRAMSGPPLPLS
jgi:hypothetical protein